MSPRSTPGGSADAEPAPAANLIDVVDSSESSPADTPKAPPTRKRSAAGASRKPAARAPRRASVKDVESVDTAAAGAASTAIAAPTPSTDLRLDLPPAVNAEADPIPDALVEHSGAHRARRRASVAREPALVARADLPDDAEGRVEIIAASPPARSGTDAHSEPLVDLAAEATVADVDPGVGTGSDQWLVIAGLATVMLIVFVVGMAATR